MKYVGVGHVRTPTSKFKFQNTFYSLQPSKALACQVSYDKNWYPIENFEICNVNIESDEGPENLYQIKYRHQPISYTTSNTYKNHVS